MQNRLSLTDERFYFAYEPRISSVSHAAFIEPMQCVAVPKLPYAPKGLGNKNHGRKSGGMNRGARTKG
jgi:hypothetical protein